MIYFGILLEFNLKLLDISQVYDILKKNVAGLVKPFSKLGSLLMNVPAFLLKQVSKVPALPVRTLQSAENFVDNLFPMESRKKLNCENCEFPIATSAPPPQASFLRRDNGHF